MRAAVKENDYINVNDVTGTIFNLKQDINHPLSEYEYTGEMSPSNVLSQILSIRSYLPCGRQYTIT